VHETCLLCRKCKLELKGGDSVIMIKIKSSSERMNLTSFLIIM